MALLTMIKNRAQPKIWNMIQYLRSWEYNISIIFAVLSNGVGMTKHPRNIKNMNEFVRGNTSREKKS